MTILRKLCFYLLLATLFLAGRADDIGGIRQEIGEVVEDVGAAAASAGSKGLLGAAKLKSQTSFTRRPLPVRKAAAKPSRIRTAIVLRIPFIQRMLFTCQ